MAAGLAATSIPPHSPLFELLGLPQPDPSELVDDPRPSPHVPPPPSSAPAGSSKSPKKKSPLKSTAVKGSVEPAAASSPIGFQPSNPQSLFRLESADNAAIFAAADFAQSQQQQQSTPKLQSPHQPQRAATELCPQSGAHLNPGLGSNALLGTLPPRSLLGSLESKPAFFPPPRPAADEGETVPAMEDSTIERRQTRQLTKLEDAAAKIPDVVSEAELLQITEGKTQAQIRGVEGTKVPTAPYSFDPNGLVSPSPDLDVGEASELEEASDSDDEEFTASGSKKKKKTKNTKPAAKRSPAKGGSRKSSPAKGTPRQSAKKKRDVMLGGKQSPNKGKQVSAVWRLVARTFTIDSELDAHCFSRCLA